MATDVLEKVGRNIPHNIEAERAVIGCLLQYNEVIDEVFATINYDMFYDFLNKAVFASIGALRHVGRNADKITAKDQAKTIVRNIVTEEKKNFSERTILEKVSGIRVKAKEIEGVTEDSLTDEFFADLLKDAAIPTSVMSYCNMVKEKYTLRKSIEIASRIIEECHTGEKAADEICNIAQDDFYNLGAKSGEKDYVVAEELINQVFDDLEVAMSAPDGITGIKTSYSQLDSLTSGLQRTDMIVLAGRPGMGKTTFSLNLAFNICKNGFSVAYFSLEMTNVQLVKKIISDLSGVSSSDMRSGRVGEAGMDALAEAARQIYNKRLFINDNSYLTIAELRNICQKIKADRGLDAVFIDYLQLMHAGTNYRNSGNSKNGFLSRWEEIGEISRNIKGLAKELNVPIVALSQLTREADKKEKIQLSDIRDSGAIEQDADIIMFLSKPQSEDKQDSTLLTIAKHRNGSTGEISFKFDKSTSSFTEWDNSNYSQMV